ncbi:MAG: DUF2461 domain-containing protein [Chloroflexi bacterium]|nr:DUF2461 domain-containing protein [Chloroflexota bacterium]
MSRFPGFPIDTQVFLRELRENNTREFFTANRARFEDVVKAPALEWVAAMGARLKNLDPNIVVDARTNGSGSLMRWTRDTRFSKDKSPYKVNIAMMWWHGSGKKMQHPAFGMQISPDDAGMMAGMFQFPKPMLEAYRRAVNDDELGQALIETVGQVEATGYSVSGLHYKTVPRGYAKDHPRAEWLKYNNLHAGGHGIPPSVIASAELIDVCTERFEKLAPIHHWLVAVQERYGGV